jgi:hypothetical protein
MCQVSSAALKGGGAWKENQIRSPFFEQCLSNIERDIVATTTRVCKLLQAKFRWPNITQAEMSVLARMSESEIGYNNADKNRGPVIYSKDLYREQCRLHLQGDKGTYGKVEMTKEDILDDVFLIFISSGSCINLQMQLESGPDP